MGKVMNVFCGGANTSIYNVQEVNSSFAVASIDIMYTGKNRNGSNISRDAVERAIHTIYNTPIVCNWDPEAREIGGHDMEVVKDSNGAMRLRNLTVPCGVITDHTKFSFQTKEDENGVEHEYFVADGVVLWKRQDVYEYIVNDLGGVIQHSMEIDIKSGEQNEETGYYDVNDFEFTAFCLLGNATPCFEGSKLQLYSADSMKNQIAEMMAELKECYSLIAPADNAVVDNNNPTEGGDMMTTEKMNLIQEFGIDVDSLDFSVEDLSVDELRAKFEEIRAAESANADDESVRNASDSAAEFDLNSNIAHQVRSAVEADVVHLDWGDIPKYIFCDFDSSTSEVYAESFEDWELYGFNYSMDGDNVVIDWESKTRKKYAIVDFDNGASANAAATSSVYSALTSVIESMSKNAADSEAKFADISAKYSDAEAELNSLREYKAQIEQSEITQKVSAVFELFSDLIGNELFEALRAEVFNDNTKYSPDTLEEKCYAIRGRLGTSAHFSLDQKQNKIQLDKTGDAETSPYGGIVEKYAGE